MNTKEGKNSGELRRTVFGRLVAIATAQIEEQEANRKQAQSEANSHVGAMESRYDTFKEDAQYLSAGYERRIRKLSEQRTQLGALGREDRPRPTLSEGALIEMADGNDRRKLVVIADIALSEKHAPGGEVEIDGRRWIVTTPQSREGQALLATQKGYLEERKYWRERQASVETALNIRTCLEAIGRAVNESGTGEAAPPSRKIPVSSKLEKAIKELTKKARGVEKEKIKDEGTRLLRNLKQMVWEKRTTRGSGRAWWIQIEEEVEDIVRELPEEGRKEVSTWKEDLEEVVRRAGLKEARPAAMQTENDEMQVNEKLGIAVEALMDNANDETRNEIKKKGIRLLTGLKEKVWGQAETQHSGKSYREQIREEVETITLRLDKTEAEQVQKWKENLEQTLRRAGAEVIQAAPPAGKPITSEKAVQWCLSGLKRAIGKRPAKKAFEEARKALEKVVADNETFQQETRTDDGPYWKQLKREIEKRIVKGDEEALKQEQEIIVSQRVSVKEMEPPGKGTKIQVVKEGRTEDLQVLWVG